MLGDLLMPVAELISAGLNTLSQAIPDSGATPVEPTSDETKPESE